MSIQRNRHPERDNRQRKLDAIAHSTRREAERRAEMQRVAAIEVANTARLRAMRLAKEATDRIAQAAIAPAFPPPATEVPRPVPRTRSRAGRGSAAVQPASCGER